MTRRRSTSGASFRSSTDSGLSVDTAYLENNEHNNFANGTSGVTDETKYRDVEDGEADVDEPFLPTSSRKPGSGSRTRQIFWALVILCLGGWVLALVLFLTQGRTSPQTASETLQQEESGSGSTSAGRPVTLQQVLTGSWNCLLYTSDAADEPCGV